VAAHFITGKDAKIYMATELKGKRLALAQRDTATTLMARWYMDYIKTGPEIVDDAIEVGSDAAVVEAVAVGKVDVGLLDERGKVLFDNKLIEGTDRVRHFYSTPSFADRLWAARPGLEPALAQALTKAMEALDDREVLDLFGASKFLAADATGWARLRGSIQAAKAVK
jgi:phosphonate transport system substrate-binding protein